MKFLVSITTIVLVFAMNRFHEDYFKDGINFFEEIGYKNSTEVFKIDLKIRKLIEVFKERQKNRTRSLNEIEKNRTRSLNEIECTKTFYEYIKDDNLYNVLDGIMKNNMEVKKLSRNFLIEMNTKLKPYLKARSKLAFRGKSLCENSSMKITFSTKTHAGFLAFLNSKKIGQRIGNWIINDSQRLLRLELRLTLNKNWQNIKYAITFSPYPMQHKASQKHKLDVVIRFTLKKIKEDNNLTITKDEHYWKLTGKHFLNTLYVLIVIFMFKFRFNLIIDFPCHCHGSPTLVRIRFQIILKR